MIHKYILMTRLDYDIRLDIDYFYIKVFKRSLDIGDIIIIYYYSRSLFLKTV